MTDRTRYPVAFVVPVDDEERSRGLAALGVLFIKPFLLLPHILLLALSSAAIQVVVWIGYWYILLTGASPYWVTNLEEIYLEWISRVFAWFTGTTDVYPTFGTDEHHPAQVGVADPPEHQSRLLAFLGIILVRSILALPHFFLLGWLTLGTIIVAWVGFVWVLVDGSLPLSLHYYFVGFHQWWARAWAYTAALTDEYPPFSLKV